MRVAFFVSVAWMALSVMVLPTNGGTAVRLTEGPIIEGRGVGPIRIGMLEAELIRDVGVPDQVTTAWPDASVPIKVADYVTSRLLFRVFLRDGSVDGVLVAAFRLDALAAAGLDVRGVSIGSELRTVRAAYGSGVDGRLWYPDHGIAFNPADQHRPDHERVYAILVVRPGHHDLVDAYGRLVH